MKNERGTALILTLIMLSLLMALGAALLGSVALESAIGDNYRTGTQSVYLAETGIDDARGMLQNSGRTTSQLLSASAGPDGILSGSRDLDVLLNTDDVPLIHGGNRTAGKPFLDTSGRQAGAYFVFLRNDSADGMTNLRDANLVVTLTSIGVLGNSRKVLEAAVLKWRFPAVPSTLILDGSPVTVTMNANTEINGQDLSGGNGSRFGIGVLTAADAASVPMGDVHEIDTILDERLRNPFSIERLVDVAIQNSTDLWSPGFGGVTSIGNIGSLGDPRIVVINGDGELDSGTGYGLLLVRGNLRLKGNYTWNGLVLVIGQGNLGWSGAGTARISGSLFLARTRAADRGPANELGTMLNARGAVSVDLSPAGTAFQLVNPGNAATDRAQQKFPFVPIALREW